jgi:hypothetical protein
MFLQIISKVQHMHEYVAHEILGYVLIIYIHIIA